jgi:WD40 repeat protein
MVATGGSDDRAYIWRVGQEAFEETGGAVLELTGHTDTVGALAFSADGSSLASGGMDGCLRVWEVASGRCIQVLEGPGDAVEWLSWHPKGNVVLAGAADFTAWMWLAQTGACMQVCRQRRQAGLAVLGQLLLAGPAAPPADLDALSFTGVLRAQRPRDLRRFHP